MFTETSVFTKQTNIEIIMFTETSVFTKKTTDYESTSLVNDTLNVLFC